MTIISFCLFLGILFLIGVLSVLENRHTSIDYLVASHSIKPWMAALSAIATNNSGYMFIGMIGFTYTVGLASIWLMVGWILGDFIISFLVHRRIRIKAEQLESVGYGSLLSNWYSPEFTIVRYLSGLITLLFLGTYAAAQLKAGSKALYVLFNWNYSTGAIIGSIIVLGYCFAGGIRASIWTDVAQSFVMLVAMILLVVFSVIDIGGINTTWATINLVSPHYMELFPQDLWLGPVAGPIMFILGWLFAGFGIIGQPHIMIRFMALDNAQHMKQVRYYYYSWYVIFYTLTIVVGLMARIQIPDTANFDAELALPLIAKKLFDPFFIGLVIAGLFAATMSTADSQIISCTAALSHDLKLNKRNTYWFNKFITVAVAVIALFIALYGHENVFSLVLIAWSALASAFAPLLIVYVLNGKPGQITAISMMLTGLAFMLIWRYLGYGEQVYEIMPGMLAGFVPYLILLIWQKLNKR